MKPAGSCATNAFLHSEISILEQAKMDSGQKLLPDAAFTSIGLPEVIAIIVILAARLLPAMTSAKSQAVKIAGLNNLKQLTLFAQIYTDDNGDMFPIALVANTANDKSYNWWGAAICGGTTNN